MSLPFEGQASMYMMLETKKTKTSGEKKHKSKKWQQQFLDVARFSLLKVSGVTIFKAQIQKILSLLNHATPLAADPHPLKT